jgi:hypothetical protein
MKKFKFLPPYTDKGKCNFPEAKERSGIYIIKENAKIVYVGESGYNLYKTLYRHFQRWNHKYQEVVTYAAKLKQNKYTVRLVFCTAKQAIALEKALIIKYNPRDNEQKYKNYQLDFYDNKALENYNKTEQTDEVPF